MAPMRAVQVVAPGRAEFVEIPIPPLQPGYALVRPHLISLCGSDIQMLHHEAPEQYPFPPGTTGHEVVARVEEVDSDDVPFKAGDLTLTLAPKHGAMAEYYLAPIEHVLPLPAGSPPEHLLMAQQLGTVIYACKQLPNLIGKTVAVIGQGSAGLWFDFMLRRLGAERIVAIDLQAHRLAHSRRYGATHTVHNGPEDPVERLLDVNGGNLADVVIEAAGWESAVNLAIALAAEYGFLLQFGMPLGQQFTIDYYRMFKKCLTNKSIVHASREAGQGSTRYALELIASGAIDVAPILTHRFPFERVCEAYELQRTAGDGSVKIVVEMPGP